MFAYHHYTTNHGVEMMMFDKLNGYGKGIAARALLESMLKQGHLETLPSEDSPGEIVIQVGRWQLELLACFSLEVKTARNERQKLREILCGTK